MSHCGFDLVSMRAVRACVQPNGTKRHEYHGKKVGPSGSDSRVLQQWVREQGKDLALKRFRDTAMNCPTKEAECVISKIGRLRYLRMWK